MNIVEILKKVTEGKELTDAEKQFLTEYKEPTPNTDREKELATKLKEAQDKLDAAERDKLSEQEKLQKDLEKAQKDLQEAREAKAAQDHDIAVRKLAAEHKFLDPEYLKYLVGRDKIDVAKDGKTFMESLKKDSPKYFDAEVNTGGGGGPGDNPGSGAKGGKEEMAELLKKENLTSSEAARVIELQGELAKDDGNK